MVRMSKPLLGRVFFLVLNEFYSEHNLRRQDKNFNPCLVEEKMKSNAFFVSNIEGKVKDLFGQICNSR